MEKTDSVDGCAQAPMQVPDLADAQRTHSVEAAARARRSVYGYLNDVVPRQIIESALASAMLAPNHHGTRPWRFFVFSGPGREPLAKAYEAAAVRLGRATAGARARALEAPVQIVVACRPSLTHPRVRLAEEEFAVAAAVENMLLSLASAGIGSLITTGDLAESDEVHALIELDRRDGRVVAVVSAGFADPQRPLRRRIEPDLESFVQWCEGA